MVTMVDPPGGWAYGFPQPLQGDYEKQLREAGYPESDIPLALAHSWYHQEPSAPLLKPEPFSYSHVVEANPQRGECWAKDRFTGTASDGDDGA